MHTSSNQSSSLVAAFAGLDGAHLRCRGKALGRLLAYPSLLLANLLLIAWAVTSRASLGPLVVPGLVANLLALFVLERVLPHKRAWHPSAGELLRDLFYFGMNGGLDTLTKMALALGVAALGSWDNGLPGWLALPLAILGADLVGYWLHRAGHSGWLWKVHGVHHSPDKVNTWNNNTIHFINTLYSGLSKTLPLWALGFSPQVIVIAAYVATLQSFAVHANVEAKLGPFGYLWMGPAHHRLHHSSNTEQAGNFSSVTTLWDILFSTFVYGPELQPEGIGVASPDSFPAPGDVLRNQLHPFIDQGRG